MHPERCPSFRSCENFSISYLLSTSGYFWRHNLLWEHFLFHSLPFMNKWLLIFWPIHCFKVVKIKVQNFQFSQYVMGRVLFFFSSFVSIFEFSLLPQDKFGDFLQISDHLEALKNFFPKCPLKQKTLVTNLISSHKKWKSPH